MSEQVLGVSRSGADYFDVYLGFWINWSKGRVHGATFTTTRQDGGLLIAFLAIFVGLAGKSFWRIGCLALHRSLSRDDLQDALYHQRQAVLRNAETPQTALWQLSRVLVAWRKKARNSSFRLSGVLVLAMLCSATFAIAGIFSSRVTTDTANEVLLTGKQCANMFFPEEMGYSEWNALTMPWRNQRTTMYLNYAQQCYTAARNAEDCHQYVKDYIPLQVTRNTGCPFEERMCKVPALSVDTGLLHSNKHLGINLPPGFEFEIRVINHCAPIVTEGYVSLQNISDVQGVSRMLYHYGNYSVNFTEGSSDYVYHTIVNQSEILYEYEYTQAPRGDYELG